MPFDNHSPSELRADRSTKALGRGLEDISHFFLSASSAPAQTGARTRVEDLAPEPGAGRPAARAGVAVIRPGTALAKDQLTATLLECQDALEHGMRALGAGVSCSPYGQIDLLTLDRIDRLTVVDVDATDGDGLLLRGISHVHWVARNVANVKRMFQKWAIDASRPPRLILVAPRFSPSLKSAVRQLTGPEIACFRYHPVESFSGTGIFIERACEEDD